MKKPARHPPADPARRIVRCPACGGPSVYAASNPDRPFCDSRCRLADLGAWASEDYRVGAPAGPEGAGECGGDADPAVLRR